MMTLENRASCMLPMVYQHLEQVGVGFGFGVGLDPDWLAYEYPLSTSLMAINMLMAKFTLRHGIGMQKKVYRPAFLSTSREYFNCIYWKIKR